MQFLIFFFFAKKNWGHSIPFMQFLIFFSQKKLGSFDLSHLGCDFFFCKKSLGSFDLSHLGCESRKEDKLGGEVFLLENRGKCCPFFFFFFRSSLLACFGKKHFWGHSIFLTFGVQKQEDKLGGRRIFY